MNQWITLLQGAVGGSAIGAIASPYVSQRSDRRTARAAAREKLAEAENARRDISAPFSEITIQLRTAAMIAGAPHKVVEKYISVAQNYRKLGLDQSTGKSARIDRSRPQNWSGFLNMDAIMAASVLSKVLWHPWTGRVLIGMRLRLKLRTWRRHTMWMVTRGAILDVHKTGRMPSDDGAVLYHYCDEHLPRHLRKWGSSISRRSRIRKRLSRRSSRSKTDKAALASS
jgi:hypothetical protein